jgi:hypothetical protein
MRIAVISDIHGNRQAFEAVLAEVDEAAWQQAERDWQGHLIVERLTVLHEHGRWEPDSPPS